MEYSIRKEVEQEAGCFIEDADFERALQDAKRKQDFLYKLERKDYIRENWYLVSLVVDYVKQNALSDFTMDLGRKLHNMEKEHSFNQEQSALTNDHIVTVSAS